MKKSYRILQLQFYKGTHPHTTYKLHTRVHMHPENSPSRIQFYMQKTKSSSSTTTTTYRGQRDLHSRKEILCIEGKEIFSKSIRVSYKTFQRHSSLSRHSRHSSLSRHSSHSRLPVTHDIPAFQAILQNFQYLPGIHPIPAFSN